MPLPGTSTCQCRNCTRIHLMILTMSATIETVNSLGKNVEPWLMLRSAHDQICRQDSSLQPWQPRKCYQASSSVLNVLVLCWSPLSLSLSLSFARSLALPERLGCRR